MCLWAGWDPRPDPRRFGAGPRSRNCLFCDCYFFLWGGGFPFRGTIPGGGLSPGPGPVLCQLSWALSLPVVSPSGRACACSGHLICRRDLLAVPSLSPKGCLWEGARHHHQGSHLLASLPRASQGDADSEGPPSGGHGDSPPLGGSLLGSTPGEIAGLRAIGRVPSRTSGALTVYPLDI